MYVNLKNENYGYAVATYGDYVAVANPALLRFNPLTASIIRTGSVDFFRYNKNTDQHDYIDSLFRGEVTISVILSSESGSGFVTETGSILRYRSRWIEIDKDAYTRSLDDGYGLSMDMYDKKLVVGTPYFTQLVSTYTASFTASAAMVEVYNLGLTEYTSYASSSNIKIATITDPDVINPNAQTASFGSAVSINRDWLVVGSPHVSSSKGMVYVFRNRSTGSAYTWSLYQKLEVDSNVLDAQFGNDLKLDKLVDNEIPRMIVGCGNSFNCEAYYFECITGSWTRTFTFKPDYTVYPLTFANYFPHESGPFNQGTNGFGMAVSTYGDAVVIGEPFDRQFHEFSGSTLYEQGSAIIFERCHPTSSEVHKIPPSSDVINRATLITTASTNESKPHATVKVGNKLYCGGWNGKFFVVNDPEGDFGNLTFADSILNSPSGLRNISEGCYSKKTGYLYFIVGGDYDTPTPGSPSTASILRINPNNISDQTVFYDGIPNGGITSNPYGFGLPPICTDDNYLYVATAHSPSTFMKIDVNNAQLVASTPWLSASVAVNNAHAAVMDSDKKFFYITNPNNYISKVQCSDLSYSTARVTVPGPASFSDDLAYYNGYIFSGAEGNIYVWKINASDLSYTSSFALMNSYGAFTDGHHVYITNKTDGEIWMYYDGDLTQGPVRFEVDGTPNEIWFLGDSYVITDFTSAIIRKYKIPFEYTLKSPTRFKQVYKTYGDDLTLKNNRMGWSVDIFENNAVVGIPKSNLINNTSCYIGGTISQLHQCSSDLENLLCGQVALIQKNTSSLNWNLTNVYQKKKKYLSPYRMFGWDTSTANRSMVVGSPIYLSDDNRQINISTTGSNGIELDSITGKSYIYNYENLKDTFHVGNVFYRNGKIILMTSGSIFNGLFFNPANSIDYEYDIQFKSHHTLFEKQIICTINPGEFNVSTNPSALVIPTASLDINKNGKVDFQDIDVILSYMQYKNTSFLGFPISTDWSSSVVITDDERSLYQWYKNNAELVGTDTLYSQSFQRWETTETWMQDVFDLNDDNKIDIRDMNIMWKYFSNRLTQGNYGTYITPSCQRKLFSDIIDYMDGLTQKTAVPHINPHFLTYESSVALDKTGSYLAPMVTTIGLYNGLDLVGIAKLGSPIKITPELPINFVVKMDY